MESIDLELREAIRAALDAACRDGSWSSYSGPPQEVLQETLSRLFGLPHVGLCSSGTIAVEIALRAAGVGPGDEVVLAGYDFPGNFRAIEAIGARPVLVDLVADTHRLDVDQLPAAWSPQTRAVIVSHLHGQSVDIPAVRQQIGSRPIAIIEDACQVPGGQWMGRMLGALGDIAVLSFGGSKLLTAGRGGAWLTAAPALAQRGRLVHDRGNDAFPLSNLQATVLVPQLQRLAEKTVVRRANVRQIWAAIQGQPDWLIPLDAALIDQSAFYKFPLLLADPARRDPWLAAAAAAGLHLGAGFRGFALRSARRCRRVGELPQATRAAAATCLLHHDQLSGTAAETAKIIERLNRSLLHSKTDG